MDKLRVMLIGCGGISRSHAVAYQALADTVDVVYCVDPVTTNAEERAAALGAKPVAHYEGLLDQVDAIDICTPHHLHYPAARAGLEAGCHVLVEKPLANELPQCEELVALAEARQRHLMCGYVLRYMPAMQLLKAKVSSGAYGDLIQIATSVEAKLSAQSLPWAASREKLGGGVLFSHGCHTIDVMCDVAGPPRRVAMFGHNVNAEWMEGEGTAQVIIEFASGALGHHTSSWAIAHARRIPTLRAWCRDGFLEVAGNNLVAQVGQQTETLCAPPADHPAAMTLQIQHYTECCRTGAKPLTDGRSALTSLRLIWGAYRSREMGQVVDL